MRGAWGAVDAGGRGNRSGGPDSKILIDANNGTTLNIAKDILERCEDVGIYWFEEPFPEDRAFNEAFKAFID